MLAEAGQPLHADEITKRVLARGVWKTEGKTPAATIHARLAVDVKERGAASAKSGHEAPAVDPAPHPTVPEKPAWVRPVVTLIIALFAIAWPVGARRAFFTYSVTLGVSARN